MTSFWKGVLTALIIERVLRAVRTKYNAYNRTGQPYNDHL